MVPDYTVELWDINNSYVLDISRFVNPHIELKLNDADVVTFDLDHKQFTDLCSSVGLIPRNVLYPAKTSVVVRRDGLVLTAGEVSIADTLQDAEGTKTLSVTVDGWLNYFASRHILKTYTATERSDIAWDAISTAQSVTYGDYGVVRGVHATTYASDFTADYTDVKTLIQRYTYARPTTYDFDFVTEIQAGMIVKVFNTYLRKGSDRPGVELVDPVNATFTRVRRSSDTLANKVIGLGAGIGLDRLQSIKEDTLSQAAYLVRESKTTFNSVIEQPTLDNNTDGLLQERKGVLATFDATVYPGTLDLAVVGVGDSVTCRMEGDPYNDDIDGLFRIYGINLDVDANRMETVSLNFYNPSYGGELVEENML